MKIKFATGNSHKVKEFKEELEGENLSIDQLEVDIDEIDNEDVKKVAERKAVDSFMVSGVEEPVMVEDTGLYIEGINGFPGSMAGYFFGKCGNEGLLKLMKGKEDRSAYFKTVIAVYYPERNDVETFTGVCDGKISEEIREEEEFGYDPVFIPEGHNKTFSEDKEHKMEVSHRKKAIEKMREWFQKN